MLHQLQLLGSLSLTTTLFIHHNLVKLKNKTLSNHFLRKFFNLYTYIISLDFVNPHRSISVFSNWILVNQVIYRGNELDHRWHCQLQDHRKGYVRRSITQFRQPPASSTGARRTLETAESITSVIRFAKSIPRAQRFQSKPKSFDSASSVVGMLFHFPI